MRDRTSQSPEPSSSSDLWSDWLLRRRFGGDPVNELTLRRAVERIRDRVLDRAHLSPDMVLIDVGSGDGLIAFGAFERVGPTMRATFVDLSEPLLNCAEERAKKLGLRDQCTFLQAPAERLDGILDDCANSLTTRAVLAYVEDKGAAARQFYRVLKPGGRLSIAEPIFRDNALQLAAFTTQLLSRPADFSERARLIQRFRALQWPSTMPEIQSNPLTNFTERDLVSIFLRAGFTEIHLELHIDVRKVVPVPWNTYIDLAPRPGAPTLREIFSTHFSDAEQRLIEDALRRHVESGTLTDTDTMAYLSANKPV
jgi:arsenite methyltransferase